MSQAATPRFEFEFTPTPSELAGAWRRAATILHVTMGVDIARRIGEFGVRMIRKRTRELHRSSRGTRMKRYSAAYARKKGVPRTQVDLTVSGTMLDGLRHERVGRDSVRLFPSDEPHPDAKMTVRELLGIHHYGTLDGRIPARRPFGFSRSEQALLGSLVMSLVDATTVESARRAIRGQR